MDDQSQAVAAAIRAAKRTLSGLDGALTDISKSFNLIQKHRSLSHKNACEKLLKGTFEQAARDAASTLVSLKGSRAINRSKELEENLRALARQVAVELWFFDEETIMTGLDAIVSDTIADLNVGVFRMADSKQPDARANITFHGSATNVAIAADGSSVEIHGSQTVTTGISVEELIVAISETRNAVPASILTETEKIHADDVLVNAARELKTGEPDAGRLKRYLSAAADVASKIGISAAGGVIARAVAMGFGVT